MKLPGGVVLAIIFLLTSLAVAEEPVTLKTQKDRVNYSIGVNVIKNFKQQDIDLDLNMVIKGMRDSLEGDKLLLSDDELRATLMEVQNAIRQKQRLGKRLSAMDNKREGEAFLAANKKKEGVVTLPSGLQYKVIKSGNGRKPADDDTVFCHYRTTLINGTEIDNSYGNNKPMAYKIKDGVIPGWKEALKLMPLGSKWQLFVPFNLAYGDRGSGMIIGQNETLIFEIELLDIQ